MAWADEDEILSLLQSLPETEPGIKITVGFSISRKWPDWRARSSAIQIPLCHQVSSTSLPEGLSAAPCTQCLPLLIC